MCGGQPLGRLRQCVAIGVIHIKTSRQIGKCLRREARYNFGQFCKRLAGLQAMLGSKIIEGVATEVQSAPPDFKPWGE